MVVRSLALRAAQVTIREGCKQGTATSWPRYAYLYACLRMTETRLNGDRLVVWLSARTSRNGTEKRWGLYAPTFSRRCALGGSPLVAEFPSSSSSLLVQFYTLCIFICFGRNYLNSKKKPKLIAFLFIRQICYPGSQISSTVTNVTPCALRPKIP